MEIHKYQIVPRNNTNNACVVCKEFSNEEDLMLYVFENFRGIPVTVNILCDNGKRPKVAIYTNSYYKSLIRKSNRVGKRRTN